MYSYRGRFATLFLGGGSPSAMQRPLLYELANWIGEYKADKTEFAIEVNPGQTEAEFFKRLKKAGVNRISIGAQSFLDSELEFLGRIHSARQIIQCMTDARTAGFENIGLDLMFAIPGSTVLDWKKSLKAAIELKPEHISAYSLTYEGDTPMTRGVAAGEIVPVDEETDCAMYETAIDTLEAAGYGQYEISNFARPGYECRHNQRYWHNDPYIGLGPAAASWYHGRRTENISDLEQYINSISNGQFAYEHQETPSALEIACETAVLNLRTRAGIEPVDFSRRTGYDMRQLFAEPIARHVQAGLMEWHNGRLRLSRRALPAADKVVCDFSAV